MRPLLLLCLLAAILVGCARDERAQQAADARAGIGAARLVLGQARALPDLSQEVARAIGEVVAVLDGVDARLPAIAGVMSSAWPQATMTPQQIITDPSGYVRTAPPEPSQLPLVAGLASLGMALLWGVGRVAPVLCPTLGGLAGNLADLAWTALAHKDQKAAEAGRDQIVTAARAAQPVLQALTALPYSEVPAAVRPLLRPLAAAALGHLAGDPAATDRLQAAHAMAALARPVPPSGPPGEQPVPATTLAEEYAASPFSGTPG
jgi:hypothetical protein